MQNTTFEDHLSRKVTKYFLFLEIAVLLFILGLIVFGNYSIAIFLSLTMIIAFLAIILWLNMRYQRNPAVIEKRDLEDKEIRLKSNIQEEKNTILAAKRNRENLIEEEKREIATTLQKTQNDYIKKELSKYLIQNAEISGVGPKLKQRLTLEGIITAADVSSQQVAAISGFGETKRLAVVGWQLLLYAKIEKTKPTALDQVQLENIKDKYKSLQEKNDEKEKRACDNQVKLEHELKLVQLRLSQLAHTSFVRYLEGVRYYV